MMSIIKKIKRRIENHTTLLKPLLVLQNKIYNRLYPNYHQISSFTLPDRYPQLFEFARNHIKEKDYKELRILSFGCSTGEECFSLATYFPEAQIIGLDINQKCLDEAKSKNQNPNITFYKSNDMVLRENGPYDLIFCMSVLCKWPATRYIDNIKGLYPFEKFNEHIQKLDSLLQPGGILFVTNANFRISDTSIYKNYTTHISPVGTEADLVPKFSSNHKKLHVENFTEFIYQKKIDNND